MFAKIFDHETIGQILVTLRSTSDGQPGVVFSFNLDGANGMTLVDTALGFAEWSLAEKMFGQMSLEKAAELAQSIIAEFNEP